MGWPKGKPHQRTLSDQDLLAIAAAPADLTTVALAAQLGRPYFTVAHARRRIQRLGGWYCPLEWLTCAECGEVVASSPFNGRREVHARCERARNVRYSRDRRKRQPGQSTPYVRAWRERDPEGNHRLREQEKARLRERWPDLPPEQQEAMLLRVHAADQRDYPVTLEQADRAGEDWTEDEDRYVLAHLRTPAREVALELGRTLWAVRNRRVRLRRTQSGG